MVMATKRARKTFCRRLKNLVRFEANSGGGIAIFSRVAKVIQGHAGSSDPRKPYLKFKAARCFRYGTPGGQRVRSFDAALGRIEISTLEGNRFER